MRLQNQSIEESTRIKERTYLWFKTKIRTATRIFGYVPDPYSDLRIRIRKKHLRIHNTDEKNKKTAMQV